MDNLHLARVEVATHPGHRGRGYASAMLDHLTAVAVAQGRNTLNADAVWAYDGPADGAGTPNADFLTRRGFAFSLGDVKRVLELPVDEGLLARLADEVAPHHPGYTLRDFAGPVPEDIIDAFGDLVGSLITEAPMGDLDFEPEVFDATRIRADEKVFEASGRTKYTTVAVAPDGSLAAYSELVVPTYDPEHVYQWGTLVRPEHRGHRLGMATKVHNLRCFQAAESGRTRLFTYNAEVNTHMIGVNDAMGFRPVQRLGEFQKKLDGDQDAGSTGAEVGLEQLGEDLGQPGLEGLGAGVHEQAVDRELQVGAGDPVGAVVLERLAADEDLLAGEVGPDHLERAEGPSARDPRGVGPELLGPAAGDHLPHLRAGERRGGQVPR